MTSDSPNPSLPISPASECCGGASKTDAASGCCSAPVEIPKEQAVRERYSEASKQREEELCCPVTYPTHLLEAIPDEVIRKDYGCGDPTPFVKPGDTVLDLGSGAGKLCFISAQLAGPKGKVIGVDCNPDMLSVARRSQPEFAKNVGFDNVEFRAGMIQDLQLDLEKLAEAGKEIDRSTIAGLMEHRQLEQRLRHELRLIPDNSVDCVISNCVLNLVQPQDRIQLFSEIYRVLKVGGRAAISDIVSDEEVPEAMQQDGELWSGCISGAWREDRFLEEFENAGFYGIEIANFSAEPWQVVEGIEFRSMTVLAHKGDEGRCIEASHAVIYAGPFEQIVDEDGNTFPRGQRMAVCQKTYQRLSRSPYAEHFVRIEPRSEPNGQSEMDEFDCSVDMLRDPKNTKGAIYHVRTDGTEDCCPPGTCC